MQVKTFPIILEEAYMLTPSVKHFVFKSELSPAFTYLPGQFITIHFNSGDKDLKRSYSIANIPGENNRIEFAAGYIKGGPGTELLFNLSPGDSININGPFGRLVLKDPQPERYILAATSTGVTPYRAMLSQLEEKLNLYPELHVVILLGVQRREDLLYADDFLKFTRSHPRITFQACYSREKNIDLGDFETIGYVQKAFPTLNLNPDKDMVYLCGNPGMIDEAFNDLKERGFTIQSIVREKYISR